jgi:hypothetical protein
MWRIIALFILLVADTAQARAGAAGTGAARAGAAGTGAAGTGAAGTDFDGPVCRNWKLWQPPLTCERGDYSLHFDYGNTSTATSTGTSTAWLVAIGTSTATSISTDPYLVACPDSPKPICRHTGDFLLGMIAGWSMCGAAALLTFMRANWWDNKEKRG